MGQVVFVPAIQDIPGVGTVGKISVPVTGSSSPNDVNLITPSTGVVTQSSAVPTIKVGDNGNSSSSARVGNTGAWLQAVDNSWSLSSPDATLNEEITASADVPNYTLEAGAIISEHVVVKPTVVRLSGEFSNREKKEQRGASTLAKLIQARENSSVIIVTTRHLKMQRMVISDIRAVHKAPWLGVLQMTITLQQVGLTGTNNTSAVGRVRPSRLLVYGEKNYATLQESLQQSTNKLADAIAEMIKIGGSVTPLDESQRQDVLKAAMSATKREDIQRIIDLNKTIKSPFDSYTSKGGLVGNLQVNKIVSAVQTGIKAYKTAINTVKKVQQTVKEVKAKVNQALNTVKNGLQFVQDTCAIFGKQVNLTGNINLAQSVLNQSGNVIAKFVTPTKLNYKDMFRSINGIRHLVGGINGNVIPSIK